MDKGAEIAEAIISAIEQVATSAKNSDAAILDLVKELVTHVKFLEMRIEELELLTRIVTTKPQ